MERILVYGMTDNPGGIETYLHHLFARMKQGGIFLDFVTDFPLVSGGDELMAAGAKLYFIPAKGRNLPGHLAAMRRILCSHPEYKTVYFNILDAGAVVTMLPAFTMGRRIVVHSHNGSTDKRLLHKLCRPLLNRMTDARVACSRLAAEHMFGPDRGALVIPNGIDAGSYTYSESVRREVRVALGLGEVPVIVHVGRLSRQKNPFGLLDIFEAVHARRRDALLLSVGGGELAEQFHRRIRQKGLQAAVKCLGVRSDVAEILQAADVFLLPSLYEGLPISLLEAQAAGLPCVISDVISREAVVTELVCQVPLEAEPDAWAEKILSRLGQPRKDTREDLVRGGFDSSCCGWYDEKLKELWKGTEK